MLSTGAKLRGTGAHLGSCLAPTLSTLTGKSSGLMNMYPTVGITQRTVLRTTLSHSWVSLREFLATPGKEPTRGKAETEPGEGEREGGAKPAGI